MIKVGNTRVKIDSILCYTPYTDSMSIYFTAPGGGYKFVNYECDSAEEIKKLTAELDEALGI